MNDKTNDLIALLTTGLALGGAVDLLLWKDFAMGVAVYLGLTPLLVLFVGLPAFARWWDNPDEPPAMAGRPAGLVAVAMWCGGIMIAKPETRVAGLVLLGGGLVLLISAVVIRLMANVRANLQDTRSEAHQTEQESRYLQRGGNERQDRLQAVHHEAVRRLGEVDHGRPAPPRRDSTPT